MWRLLVTITVRKAWAKARHHTAGLRDVAVEQPPGKWLADAVSREPDPADAAALVDEIEQVLRDLPELHGRVLQMRIEGRPADEIAGEQGVSRRTVYRILELLEQRLTAQKADGNGP